MANLEKLGVVGAGNMGSGIAQKAAQEGINVVLVDIKDEFVRRGLDNIRATLNDGVKRKIFGPEQVKQTLSRISGTTDMAALKDCDLIIEAVFEDEKVKRELFTQLDKLCDSKTVLATNTSSFAVTKLGGHIGRKSDFAGLHFFYHPAKNRLVEVIPGEDTSRETTDYLMLASKLMGKTAILVKDAPGFAVNRFFVPWLNEAVRLLEEGAANIPTIDAAAKEAFRIDMGPFELMNLTGVPIAYHSTVSLGGQLSSFYGPAARLTEQFKSGQQWDLTGEVDRNRFKVVRERLYGVAFGLAAQIVQDGIASMEDTDRGAKIGLRWALGPFELMNHVGIDRSCSMVEAVAGKYEDFNVPDILRSQRESGHAWEFSFVDLHVKDGVATITLNRPEALNALNEIVMAQLEKRFNEAESNPEVKAIVFQGAGKAFAAGADIRFLAKNIENKTLDKTAEFARRGHELLKRIERSPKLTIARMEGITLGGGLETALAADLRIASTRATMGFPETGIGIYPGLGGTQRTPRLIGAELARYLIFTGNIIAAEEAAGMGLVDAAVAPSEVDAAVAEAVNAGKPRKKHGTPRPDERFRALIEIFSDKNVEALISGGEVNVEDPQAKDILPKIRKRISSKAPIALKLASRIINEGLKADLNKGLQMELDHLAEIFSTEDAYEGLMSLGRGRPEYKGK